MRLLRPMLAAWPRRLALRPSVRLFCDKVERPPELGRRPPPAPERKGPVSWFNLAASGVLMGAGLAFYYYARGLKEEALAKERRRTLGKAAIGGRFDLVDHTGKAACSEDFHGKWVLLYFGFTHCPDICPEEMEKMAEVVDALAAKASDLGEVQPLFVTVDPRRDGVAEVAEYVKEFHPRLIGLTGTDEMIKNVCRAFRVYYSSGPADEDDDYIVDHTIILYVLDPKGGFVDYFGQTKTAAMVTDSVMMTMGKWKAEQRQSSGLLAKLTG